MSPTNRLMEAVQKDDKLNWEHDFIEKARGNSFFHKVMKEMVLSDVSGALGYVYDVAVDAAKNIAAGKDLIWTVPVTQPLARFYKAKRGVPFHMEDGVPLQGPEKYDTKDITVNKEWGLDALFSQAYLEDCPFSVLQRAVTDAVQGLEEKFTKDITTLIEAIVAATGGLVEIAAATANTFAWADLVAGWTQVKKAGYRADTCLLHPDQIADLFKDTTFINSFAFGEKVDVQRGVLGDTYLGIKIVETDLCTAAKAHIYDSTKMGACAMRRELLTQPYEEKAKEGVIVSKRYGLGVIREDSVARITGC